MLLSDDPELLESLCIKHDRALPRYTSYPTAIELKRSDSEETAKKAIQTSSNEPLSLYIHLPYCASLCYFCACNKIIDADPEKRDQYLDLLDKEAALIKSAADSPVSISQVHLGGGSPSLLDPDQFERLFDILNRHFDLSTCTERSIEVDPRTFSKEKVDTIAKASFNRASLGVQDFDPKVQELINRVQPYEQTEEITTWLRESGIQNINLDLIYGLPGQTLDAFSETIKQVLKLRPERIALYGYAHVKWKVKVQQVLTKYGIPDALERIHLFEAALKLFEQAGYEYIGLDHFALPEDELCIAQRNGKLRRNFMGYTTVCGSGVLGMGVSAISDISSCLYQNQPNLKDYQSSLESGMLPIVKELSRTIEDEIRAFCIERLMCDDKLEVKTVLREFPNHAELVEKILSNAFEGIAEYETDNLVNCSDSGVEVTRLGRLFLRHLAAPFDAYLSSRMKENKAVFSKSL